MNLHRRRHQGLACYRSPGKSSYNRHPRSHVSSEASPRGKSEWTDDDIFHFGLLGFRQLHIGVTLPRTDRITFRTSAGMGSDPGHDVAGFCWSRLCLPAITTQGVFRLDQQTSRHEETATFGGLFLWIAVATQPTRLPAGCGRRYQSRIEPTFPASDRHRTKF